MTPERDALLLTALLGPLHTHFLAADQAYADYIANGKNYLFACTLRRLNTSTRELLLRYAYLLPGGLEADALALLRHYDVWLTLWEELAARATPTFGDQFVFSNSVNFPCEARERLVAEYRRLAS